MQWFAVHTKPRSEDLAVVHLKTKGLEVFLPKIQVLRKRGSQKVALMEPLFLGYFFVHMLPAKELISQVNLDAGGKAPALCWGHPGAGT
jgi:transcriptional antiterminator RfaH